MTLGFEMFMGVEWEYEGIGIGNRTPSDVFWLLNNMTTIVPSCKSPYVHQVKRASSYREQGPQLACIYCMNVCLCDDVHGKNCVYIIYIYIHID